MGRWLVAVLCAALVTSGAWAQTRQQPIAREQSKLWLEDVPGIAVPLTGYVYVGWTPNYSAELFYGYAVAQGRELPRLQVNLAVLAPGFIWMRDAALDETYLRNWGFFKNRGVAMATRMAAAHRESSRPRSVATMPSASRS